MNLNEIIAITKWANALGLSAYDIWQLKLFYGFDNNRLINYLSACFSYGNII